MMESTEITYQKARDMTLWAWNIARDTGMKPSPQDFIDEWNLIPTSACGYCHYYDNDCDQCPLKWNNPKEESHSNYEIENPFYCSRTYWKWNYWGYLIGKEQKAEHWAKYWADKFYHEILLTPISKPRLKMVGKEQKAKREQMIKHWMEKQRENTRKKSK